MKKMFFLMLVVLMSGSIVYGAQKSRIELTDGSTVEGEIVLFSQGKYTVKSPSLGTFQVEDSKVRNIRMGDSAAASSEKEKASVDAAAVQNEMQKLQSTVAGDPDIMKMVSDPNFQDLLKDPEIMSAAKSMDIKALMANKKFAKVVHDPSSEGSGSKAGEKNR